MKNAFKKHKYIYASLLVVLIVGGYYGYKKMYPNTAAVQYKTATAEKKMLLSSISASGNITVDQSATVDPTISGTVANLYINLGDSVKKGQLLFEIINDNLSVNVAKASTSYQQANNSLRQAKINQLQAKADYKDNDKKINQQKVDLANNDVAIAKMEADVAFTSYRNEVENAAKRKVVAPISGTVNAINVKNGDNLGVSSSNHVASIIIGDLETLKAQVQVNEVDIINVAIGQKATLILDAIQGFTASGKVKKVDSLGTTTQGVVTYNVTIDLDSLDQRIKPDMSLTAAIITDVKQDVLTVPVSAVKTQSGSSYVEVLNNGTTPTQVPVEIGISNGTDTEIISGIKAGDKVVTQTINPSTTSASSSSSSTQNRSGGSGGARMPGFGGFGGGHVD